MYFETGLYYLQSRYYNPNWGRFINADSQLNNDLLGNNQFAYAYNNPISYSDPTGHAPQWLLKTLSVAMIIGGCVCVASGWGGPLGGVLISAGANSLISGSINEASGGSYAAGWTGGLFVGAISGFTAGLGGNLIIKATESVGVAAIGCLAAGIGTSYAGGIVGNIAGNLITSGMDQGVPSVKGTVDDAAVVGMVNIFSGYGSGISSAILASGSNPAYAVVASAVALSAQAITDGFSYVLGKAWSWAESTRGNAAVTIFE